MEEHAVLMSAYGRAQQRCSRLLAEQAAQIATLESEVVRLRAALVLRDSAMDAVREELTAHGAPHSRLLRRLLGLLQVGRGRSKFSQRAAVPADAGLREKAVLCIDRGESASTLAQQLVEIAGGRYLHQRADELETADDASFEASLRAADLVICQTGCVSHGAWWRVQDHCRRTGKPCVMVGGEGANALHPVQWLRREPAAEPPPESAQLSQEN